MLWAKMAANLEPDQNLCGNNEEPNTLPPIATNDSDTDKNKKHTFPNVKEENVAANPPEYRPRASKFSQPLPLLYTPHHYLPIL